MNKEVLIEGVSDTLEDIASSRISSVNDYALNELSLAKADTQRFGFAALESMIGKSDNELTKEPSVVAYSSARNEYLGKGRMSSMPHDRNFSKILLAIANSYAASRLEGFSPKDKFMMMEEVAIASFMFDLSMVGQLSEGTNMIRKNTAREDMIIDRVKDMCSRFGTHPYALASLEKYCRKGETKIVPAYMKIYEARNVILDTVYSIFRLGADYMRWCNKICPPNRETEEESKLLGTYYRRLPRTDALEKIRVKERDTIMRLKVAVRCDNQNAVDSFTYLMGTGYHDQFLAKRKETNLIRKNEHSPRARQFFYSAASSIT